MCYTQDTFIKQISGLSDRLIYLLRRARTHEGFSCDSEIIDPTKISYFRLFFYVFFRKIRYHIVKYFVNKNLYLKLNYNN